MRAQVLTSRGASGCPTLMTVCSDLEIEVPAGLVSQLCFFVPATACLPRGVKCVAACSNAGFQCLRCGVVGAGCVYSLSRLGRRSGRKWWWCEGADEEGEAVGERAEADDESDELLSGLQALSAWPLVFLRFGMAIEDDMVLAGTELGLAAAGDEPIRDTAREMRGREEARVRTGKTWSRKRRERAQQQREKYGSRGGGSLSGGRGRVKV